MGEGRGSLGCHVYTYILNLKIFLYLEAIKTMMKWICWNVRGWWHGWGWQSRQSDRGEKWCKNVVGLMVMVVFSGAVGGGGGYDGDGGGGFWYGRGRWWCRGPDNPIEGQSGVRYLPNPKPSSFP